MSHPGIQGLDIQREALAFSANLGGPIAPILGKLFADWRCRTGQEQTLGMFLSTWLVTFFEPRKSPTVRRARSFFTGRGLFKGRLGV